MQDLSAKSRRSIFDQIASVGHRGEASLQDASINPLTAGLLQLLEAKIDLKDTMHTIVGQFHTAGKSLERRTSSG